MALVDVQEMLPKWKIPIEKVGIENVKTFMRVKKKDKSLIDIPIRINSYSSLHKEKRGTNMSRFVEIFSSIDILSQHTLKEILVKLRKSLRFDDVYLRASFYYPIKKESPVSKKEAIESIKAAFIGVLRHNKFTFVLEVDVPTSSCCPCSKSISEYGAHNQRSLIKVQVLPIDFVWIEDIVNLVSRCGSCEVYPLLKRPDEKYVTEKMYNNPKFVEDIVREAGYSIKSLPIKWYRVKVINYESIHSHNAVAYLSENLVRNSWKLSKVSFY